MPNIDINGDAIAKFLDAISVQMDAYTHKSFHYYATRTNSGLILQQARIILTTEILPNPTRTFKSDSIEVGACSLSDLGINLQDFLAQVTTGIISIPGGEVVFPAANNMYNTYFNPIHPEGAQTQSRLSYLYISGEQILSGQRPELDWELKAHVTPYDNIAELLSDYRVYSPQVQSRNIEVFATKVAAIGQDSTIQGNKATLRINLPKGLLKENARIGYRIHRENNVVRRATLDGNSLFWEDDGTTQIGTAEIDVPADSAIHSIASYNGVAQHFWWFTNPEFSQNQRRVLYGTFDPNLASLQDLCAEDIQRGRPAREFESAVSWLLWMLGFSCAHLGAIGRTSEAVDIIATIPNGDCAVIECTRGTLKSDSKLSLVMDRTSQITRKLNQTKLNHVRVLPIIISSKPKSDLIADIEQAERLGILVLGREDLMSLIQRTVLFPDPIKIYNDAYQEMIAARNKHQSANKFLQS